MVSQDSTHDSMIRFYLYFLILIFSIPSKIVAQVDRKPVNESYYIYKGVPDIEIATEDSNLYLSDLWKNKPMLLTFVFAECDGICGPYLKSLNRAIKNLGGSGIDYNTVVLSFDTTDSWNKVRKLSLEAGITDDEHFILATTRSNDLNELLKATGFWFEKIGFTNQFDHPAQVIGISDGKIKRILVGSEVSIPRLSEVLFELKGFYIQSYPIPSENVLFRCFQVDPETGAIRLDWGFIFLMLPFILAFTSVVLIFRPKRIKTASL